MQKKYIVRLSDGERELLKEVVKKLGSSGKTMAQEVEGPATLNKSIREVGSPHDSDEAAMEQQLELRKSAAELLLVERAKEWLLGD